MCNSCRSLIVFPRTLRFKVNLSCILLKTTKQSFKMIIKGRCPTVRHVPGTHRVAVDWLFERINWDSRVQIGYVDTKNQLPDILTEGSSTRDEWSHLLHLFNIVNFSMFSCRHFFFLNRKQSVQSAMAKRRQEGSSGDSSPMAKPRSLNMVIEKPRSICVATRNMSCRAISPRET